MDYQWYPGHMTRAKRMMQEDIRLVDLVIELIDARIPLSGRNPDLEELAKGKSRIILLCKADLADPVKNEQALAFFRSQGKNAMLCDARNRSKMKEMDSLVKEACREKLERNRRRGIINRPLRAMVVGIPNVGKSTLINSYAGRSAAKTGNKPGVTRGKQWIRLNQSLELLDTPGILWPKFEDQEIGIRLAITGAIRDEILQSEELALWLLDYLHQYYPGMIRSRYLPEDTKDFEEFPESAHEQLECIARLRSCLKKGGEPDTEKAARLLLDDFRSARLGRITLDQHLAEEVHEQ